MRFPGGVGVVVEVVRVFDQVSEFVGVGPVEDLIGRTQPLDAQVTEGPQQHSRREMHRIGYAQKGLDHRPEGDRYKQVVRRGASRSEEHKSELQSLMRISYAVFCMKKQTITSILPDNKKT